MSYPSGEVAGNMLWHVYRYPQKPETLMRLGSILAEPDNLESSINLKDGIEPFPEDEIIDQTPAVKRVMKASLNRGGGSSISATLPAFLAPIVSAGGSLGATLLRDVETVAEALDIRAKIVLPDSAADYMNRALSLPSVEARLRQTRFQKPLYMIVGVATCRKLTLGETVSRQIGSNVDLNVSLAAQSVEAGVNNEFKKNNTSETELVVDEECAFAYRVRKFRYLRINKKVYMKNDWVKGAMFGVHDEDGQEVEDPMLSAGAEFDYFEDDDEDLCSVKDVGIGAESMIAVQIAV